MGYSDGSELTTSQLLAGVQRIQKVAKVPLSVDIEDGYLSSPEKVADLCKTLVEIRVADINI